MKPYSSRKLFLYYDSPFSSSSSTTSSNDSSSSCSPPSSSKHNPPFDSSSSMALTIVVLLTALFFMGFFSIYIRRMSEDPTPPLSRRRRYRGSTLDSFLFPSDHHHRGGPASGKGLDLKSVRSLPVYSCRGNAKYLQMDCAICLCEFEDQEYFKTIPSCKHIFHVECIDTGLATHVSCPVCRGTRLFNIKGGGDCSDGDMGAMQLDRTDSTGGESSTVEIGDTCMVMGTTSRMRRTKSCSSSMRQQEAILQRTLSF